jgi:hypothetical protein
MARLDEVDVLVTDDGLDPEGQRVVSARVGRLLLAPQDVSSDPVLPPETRP